MDDLNARTGACQSSQESEVYHVLNIAGLLRSLVYDHPLYVVVNKKYRIQLEVPQWVMPTWKGIDRNKKISSLYVEHCHENLFHIWSGGRWYPYAIDVYLRREQPGFVLNSQTITPAEAIRYYANVLGGIHLDGSIKEKDAKAAMMDGFAKIGKNSAVAHLLITRIAPDVFRALYPLYEAARAAVGREGAAS